MEKTYAYSEIKAIDRATMTIHGIIASDASVDRYNEIILAGGWDLKNYKKNPVMLWAHNSSTLPIARAENVRVENDALRYDAVFSRTYPFARQVFDLYDEKILNAVSVGFIPIKADYNADGKLVFSKQELLEISAVPVPANPNALAKMIKLGISFDDGIKKRGAVEFVEHKGMYIPGNTKSIDSEVDLDDIEDQSELRKFYAFYDVDLKKGIFLHHNLDGTVDKEKVEEGIESLLEGKSLGMELSEEERVETYNHLKKHLEEFGEEAREYKTIDETVNAYSREIVKDYRKLSKALHKHLNIEPVEDESGQIDALLKKITHENHEEVQVEENLPTERQVTASEVMIEALKTLV